MKLYVVRHGRTRCNELGLFNGQLDEDIDEKGIQDAMRAKEELRGTEFDIIYCSPLLRARHTLELINEKRQPVIYDERLMERTLGPLDGKRLLDEGITMKKHLNYYFKYHIEGAEELSDLFFRAKSFLHDVKEKHADDTVLAVTHGGLIRAMHYYINGIPEDGDLSDFHVDNCQIIVFEL